MFIPLTTGRYKVATSDQIVSFSFVVVTGLVTVESLTSHIVDPRYFTLGYLQPKLCLLVGHLNIFFTHLLSGISNSRYL